MELLGVVLIILTLLYVFFAKNKDIFSPEFSVNFYYIFSLLIGGVLLSFVDVSTESMYTAFSYNCFGYIALNAGFFCASLTTKRVGFNYNFSSSSIPKFFAVCVVFLSFISALIFYLRSGTVPIFSADIEAARTHAMNIGGNGYLLYFMTASIPAVIVYFSISLGRVSYISAVFLILIAGFVLISTGSRRYALWLLIGILVVYNYKVQRIRRDSALIVAVMIISFVVVFEFYRSNDEYIKSSALMVLYTRFVVLTANFGYILDTIPSYVDFQFGATFLMDILTLMPGKQDDYQTWLKVISGRDFEGFGMPIGLVGDLYINFGIYFSLIIVFFFGYVLKFSYRSLTNSCSELSTVIYCYLLIYSMKSVTAGFSPQLMLFSWDFCVLLFLAFVGGVRKKSC